MATVRAVGIQPLVECPGGGHYRPGRGSACDWCARWLTEDVNAAWADALTRHGVPAGEDRAFAELVVDDPRTVPWRVVDAALDRLRCVSCGLPLGRGPLGCPGCDSAHERRWLAAEPDRPHVPPGNEHAIRVATAVARLPHRFAAQMVPLYAANLPLLLAGQMPHRGLPSAIKRYAERGGDPELVAFCRSYAEVERRLSLV